MFTKSAKFYDALYQKKKNFSDEADAVRKILQQRLIQDGSPILDVACGTGAHLAHLVQWYQCEGIDIEPGMVKIAQDRNPETAIHCGNMSDFNLDKQFDAIICLFSSIGYTKTLGSMQATIKNFAKHLNANGVLLVEPWFTPDTYKSRFVSANLVDNPDIKICRIDTSKIVDGVSHLELHYMVGSPDGVEFFVEHHELGLFTHDQYFDALTAAGMKVEYDPVGLTNRGLYIGRKQQ